MITIQANANESTAEVRRAQEAVLRSRPFSETLERILGGLLQRVKTEGLDLPLLEARTVKKVGLASISGERVSSTKYSYCVRLVHVLV